MSNNPFIKSVSEKEINLNKKVFLLILVTLFLISFANAAEVCCEKTIDNKFCQYIDSSQCSPDGKQAQTNCAFTSFCTPGCCFDLSDGRCYANSPQAACLSRGADASFAGDQNCDVAQCKMGCCIIGQQASFITQTRCKKETSNYPDLQMVFKEDVKDEASCLALSRSKEKGCCVQNSDSCLYTTRDNCPIATGTEKGDAGFFKNTYCSDSKLTCDCTPGLKTGKKGCLGDSDNVYYFDSCGNPEQVAEKCDYTEGTTCGFDKEKNDYTCLDLNCKNDYEIFDATGKIVIAEDSKIQNGESWCEFDVTKEIWGTSLPLLYGKDLPGSRYYRGFCINNKMFVEPCEDFRSQWCVQDTTKVKDQTYNVAGCIKNKFEDCYYQNTQTNCENTYLRDCFWTSLLNEKGELIYEGPNGAALGTCRPLVTPGNKFWEGEGADSCAAGSEEVVVKIYISGLAKTFGNNEFMKGLNDFTRAISLTDAGNTASGFWQFFTGIKELGKIECLEGCQYLTREALIQHNNMCRTLGDCGADYNIIKDYNLNSFSRNPMSKVLLEQWEPLLKSARCGNKKCDENYGDTGITVQELDNWILPYQKKEADYNLDARKSGSAALTILGTGVTNGIWDMAFMPWAGRIGIGGVTAIDYGKQFARSVVPFGDIFKLFGVGKGAAETNGGKKITEKILSTLFKTPDWMYKKQTLGSLLDNKQFVQNGAFTDAGEKLFEGLKGNEKFNDLFYVGGDGKDILKDFSVFEKDSSLEKLKSVELDKSFLEKNDLLKQNAAGKWMQGVNIIKWVYAGVSLYDDLGSSTHDVKITFTCSPWQAPLTSKNCEDCNALDDRENRKCSEYTCKSFGQNCVLLNAGTGNDSCVSQDPRDVKPPFITVWQEGLGIYKNKVTETRNVGYKYNEDIPAYTIFPIALNTSEPAICKGSLNKTLKFDEMPDFIGSTLYGYDHLQLMALPNQYTLIVNGTPATPTGNTTMNGTVIDPLATSSMVLVPGGTFIIYVKCKDSLGNENLAPYTIKFSIKKGPDTTPPIIEGSSIISESYVTYGINDTKVDIYVNEPSDCKWSVRDQDYEKMEGETSCKRTPNDIGLYECAATVSPIVSGIVNNFYFRCKDQPGVTEKNRNVNSQSFKLTLRGSNPLIIDSIKPDSGSEIHDYNFTLRVETSKGATLDGKSYCYYGENKEINSMIQFYKTNASVHEQVLSPVRRDQPYTYYVTCVDYGGNMANATTSVKVQKDSKTPEIMRVYTDDSFTPPHLVIILTESADCQYKLEKDFTFGDGTAMASDELKREAVYEPGATYYIKCKDASNNMLSYLFHASLI
ncbi:MAG: hypothetical protein WC413_00055 [Candidatus Nanoarchaeia archaeon]